jgi:hypothetical protein
MWTVKHVLSCPTDLEDDPEGPGYTGDEHEERPRDPEALGDMSSSSSLPVVNKVPVLYVK